ncbi:hypothetical protein B0H13DRAFT_2009921 [Mycena leptocephala]|nr:hypothetical protein B0H13DRAFT_2009921 [Mycena leptocephala]
MSGLEDQFMDMLVGLALTCRQGDKLFDAGKIAAAKAKYYQEAKKIVGSTFHLPRCYSSVYTGLNPLESTNLAGCCLGMAKCLAHEKQVEMALAWLEEVNSLYRCTYFFAKDPLYDWMDFTFGVSETKVFRARALSTTLQPLSEELNNIVDFHRLADLYQSRHPNPHTTLNLARSSALQTRGSWRKLNVAKSGGVTDGRENFACFIWHSGSFYVAGGRKTSFGPWYRDLWVLDLNTRDAWRKLPDYPRGTGETGMFTGWNMIVHNNTAILFTGRPTVDVFDLVHETWTSFKTTYSPTAADIQAGVQNGWPYPRELCSDSTMQIAHNKLYVFGGEHGTTSVGCNLFMELDLATRRWRGSRGIASSWVSPDKKRIFVMFGQADRQGASLKKELHGSTEAFGYEDMWSWSIGEERWRRERMSGNPPCARTEMACAYNEKLQKTIVFGGYHPSLPTMVLEQHVQFIYSYFADTFVYDMTPAVPTNPEPTLSAPKWKQVLTHGFPTYRCQAQIACDPDTGRTYMFGGWTNNQYIPTRTKLFSRSFGDLWELRIDEPGGHFEEVDVEDEARSAKAGPWQRCFSCGAAGPWKKCGGSCKGRVFFCGGSCLKDGWKEHKEMHKCGKA